METIFNELPKFSRATNPTNIIWENRHIKGNAFRWRALVSSLIIIFVLGASFAGMFALKRSVMALKQHDCQAWKAININATEEQKFAAAQRELSMGLREGLRNKDYPKTGALECYCIESFTTADFSQADVTSIEVDKGAQSFSEPEKKKSGKDICPEIVKKHSADKTLETFVRRLVTYLIVGANIVLRLIAIYVVEHLGCNSESTKMRYTTSAIFLL
jgi:hypothetical protein